MTTINSILIHAHSGWRWIVLLLLLTAIVKMHLGWKKKKEFTAGDKKLAMFTMIAFHLQFVGGIILFFTSQKVQFVEGMMANKVYRFFGMEHLLMMAIAMVLITIGHSKSKKAKDAVKKFKMIAVFYTIAFVIILAAIPWPFRELGSAWF